MDTRSNLTEMKATILYSYRKFPMKKLLYVIMRERTISDWFGKLPAEELAEAS